MSNSRISIDIKNLVGFFDTSESKGNASALMGLFGEELITALLQHFLLSSHGTETEVLCLDKCPISPKLGTKKSKWLDRWLVTTAVGSDTTFNNVLFQVEVKSWSSTTKGGISISEEDSLDEAAESNWSRHFDANKCCFKEKGIEKVLIPMKPPIEFDPVAGIRSLHGFERIAIAACWEPILIDGFKNRQAFAEKKAVKPSDWLSSYLVDSEIIPNDSLYIFSASNYLRGLVDESVTLELPQFEQRLAWLDKFFRIAN